MIVYPFVKIILLTPAGEDLEILFGEGLLGVLVSLQFNLSGKCRVGALKLNAWDNCTSKQSDHLHGRHR